MGRGYIHDTINGPYYLWTDIQKLIEDGLIERKPQETSLSDENSSFHGEDYGSYHPPNQKDDDETFWPEEFWWVQSCCDANVDSPKRNTLPYITEIRLFREFRYRFDPRWSPEKSAEDNLREYIHFARPWARKSCWMERPWRIKNFPQQPRTRFMFPNCTTLAERLNDHNFQYYQFLSAKIRALLKAFPDILRSPSVWRQCMINQMRDISIKEAVKIALLGRSSWQEPVLEDFEFRIQKEDDDLDVQFVRRGKNLQVGTQVNVCERSPQEGEVWKIDIIRVGRELVQIHSQTRVGGGANSFRFLLDE